MKRYLPLALVLVIGVMAIVIVQREDISTRPSPRYLLTAVADAQQELTRMPASFDRMTDDDEIALGNEMAKQTAASLGATTVDPSRDAAMQAYVQAVGGRVAAPARRKLPWTFHYVPAPKLENAFALPGGHVFIGEGLLAHMQSEDALAAVLGHEVEHIDLRHCAERAQTQAHIRQLGAAGDLVGLPIALFMAGYSKQQELEADRDGTTLAVQAGYSYTGILRLLDQFAIHEITADSTTKNPGGPVGEAAELSVATFSGYLVSHPSSQQRSERIRQFASERNWPEQPLTPLARKAEIHSARNLPPS